MVENRFSYWFERLPIDGESKFFNDGKKLALVKSALETIVTSTPEDLDLFLNPSQLGKKDLDKVLRVAAVAKQVADFFGYSVPKYEKKEEEKRFTAFFDTFRSVTNGFYLAQEQDELCNMLKPPTDAIWITMYMFGGDNPLIRRIRNVYLPSITSLIQVDVDDHGKITGGKDITHTLFDGPEDASDQIDHLLGK
ncbi:MAG: hypothetical protein Q8P92_05460 [Candidatus Daviesbacteria bacterium]|nr:hypothetical protein [Candidatus Daviesbacteria bacterium]